MLDIVVKGVFIADAIDGFSVDREDVAMPFKQANLFRIIRTGEAAEIELRNIVMPLRRPGGHCARVGKLGRPNPLADIEAPTDKPTIR